MEARPPCGLLPVARVQGVAAMANCASPRPRGRHVSVQCRPPGHSRPRSTAGVAVRTASRGERDVVGRQLPDIGIPSCIALVTS